MNNLIKKFEVLKNNGLEAANPDQSFGMFNSFKELIEVCRWKGFSEKDIKIIFETALNKEKECK